MLKSISENHKEGKKETCCGQDPLVESLCVVHERTSNPITRKQRNKKRKYFEIIQCRKMKRIHEIITCTLNCIANIFSPSSPPILSTMEATVE